MPAAARRARFARRVGALFDTLRAGRLHRRMDRRRWRQDDPLYRQVLVARQELERLDDLLMRISFIAGPRHPRARRVGPP